MESLTVTTPNGTVLPASPAVHEAVDVLHKLDAMLSNQKKKSPMPRSRVLFKDDPDAEKIDNEMPDAKMPAAKDARCNDTYDAYQHQLRETQRLLRDLELRFERAQEVHDQEKHDAAERENSTQLRQDEVVRAQREQDLFYREREMELREQLMARTSPASPLHKKETNSNVVAMTCALPVCDPAANVINDLSNCLSLESGLFNERLQIATVLGLFKSTLKSFPSMLKILNPDGSLLSVQYALQKFMNEFTSLKKVTQRSTMAVVKILALSMMSDELAVRVSSAVKISAVSEFGALEGLEVQVSLDGKIPSIDTESTMLALTDLPGMKQLAASSTEQKEIHWDAIGSFVVAALSFVTDKTGKLSKAKADLEAFDATSYTDCELMLAAYEALWNICVVCFGSRFETDYDKVQRCIKGCSAGIRIEYAGYVADPRNKMIELQMSWDDLKTALSFSWNMLSTKSRIQASLSSVRSGSRTPTAVLKNRQKNVPKLPEIDTAQKKTAIDAFMEKRIADLIDIQLECSVCDINFVFAVSQQENFIEKEFENIPSKCEKCRGQKCNQFADTGSCSFGSSCKFLHETSEVVRESPAFDVADKLPGSIKRPCTFHDAGRCLRGDDCAFQHKGREIQQEERAVAVEKELKSKTVLAISKEEAAVIEEMPSDIPKFGRRGLRPASWSE